MYLKFYGLTEKPFSQTPDPRFLYWNDSYREALASLRYGIQERKGFLTMIGEAGTGKTTLLRKLLDDLGPDVVSVFLFNPNASFEEILEYTLSELGIMVPSGRKLAMLQRLNEFLLAAFAEGKNTILLIDEAQDLDTEVLESLRLLSNLETAKEKILQIVLSGQPELATRLAQDNLRQLKQRIAVRCRLEPLQRSELPEYIRARLCVAGGDERLFEDSSHDAIWRFANGIPRLVNTVCDNALLVGYAVGKARIDGSVVDEVVQDLQRLDDRPPAPVAAPFGGAAATAAAAPPASAPTAPPRVAATETPATETSASAPPVAAGGGPVAAVTARRGNASEVGPAAAAASVGTTAAARPPGAAMAPGRQPAPRSGATRVAALVLGGLVLVAGGIWVGASLRPGGEPIRVAERAPDAAPPAIPDRLRPAAPAGAEPPRPAGPGADAPPPEPAAAAPANGASAPAPAPAPESRPAAARLDAPAAAAPAPPPPAAAAPAEPQAELAAPNRVGAALPPPADDPPRSEAGDSAAAAARDGTPPGPAAAPAIEPPRIADEATAPAARARPGQPARRSGEAHTAPLPGLAPAAPVPREASDASADRAGARGAAPDARAEARSAAGAAARASQPHAAPQDVQDSLVAENAGGKEIRVRPGDTLYQLAWRTYGTANYTTLDMLRAANPGIRDVNRIVAGRVLVFPEPGPEARVVSDNGSLAVLALTTPDAGQAEGVQRKLQEKLGERVDVEPVQLGEGQRLYRVYLRELQGESQARSIAETLGTILDDPDERPGS